MAAPKKKVKTPPFPLNAVLARLGMSKNRLAKIGGVGRQRLVLLSKKTANPTWKVLMRIVAALGCSLAEFDPANN